MQKVTLKAVKEGCLAYYKAKRLIAQMISYKRKITYRVGEYRCAVGTALNDETLTKLDQRKAFDGVFVDGIAEVDPPSDWPAIKAIQDAHDIWAQAKGSRGKFKKIFLNLIA